MVHSLCFVWHGACWTQVWHRSSWCWSCKDVDCWGRDEQTVHDALAWSACHSAAAMPQFKPCVLCTVKIRTSFYTVGKTFHRQRRWDYTLIFIIGSNMIWVITNSGLSWPSMLRTIFQPSRLSSWRTCTTSYTVIAKPKISTTGVHFFTAMDFRTHFTQFSLVS